MSSTTHWSLVQSTNNPLHVGVEKQTLLNMTAKFVKIWISTSHLTTKGTEANGYKHDSDGILNV